MSTPTTKPRQLREAEEEVVARFGTPQPGPLALANETGGPTRDSVDLSLAGIAPKNHAVTYKIIPELASLQGRVIDRITEETIREVPPDARIELALRTAEYLGTHIDTRA